MNRASPSTGWARNPDGTLGYTWNPITGCLNHVNGLCKGGGFLCYAYKLAWGRCKGRYLHGGGLIADRNYQMGLDDPFYPRLWPEKLPEYDVVSGKDKGIFVCDMSDLFGIGVPEEWTRRVLDVVRKHPQHRFYLLTKQPQNLAKWTFPPNAWVGVTATNPEMARQAMMKLQWVEAKIKYLSIEPLLEGEQPHWRDLYYARPLNAPANMDFAPGINWVIIGAQTKPMRLPELVHVSEIVEACDHAGVKVFLKDNLHNLMLANYHLTSEWGWRNGKLRQELPQ